MESRLRCSRRKCLKTQNCIQLYLSKKYVDDVNLVLETLKAGTKWNGSSLEWKEEWEKADLEDGEDDDTRTMREIRKLSNSLLPFIKFKEDVPANHESKKIPVLDFQVWAEEEETDQESGIKTRLAHGQQTCHYGKQCSATQDEDHNPEPRDSEENEEYLQSSLE